MQNRMRLIRDALGETQRGMAKRLGLGVNGWQNYELGRYAPSWEVLAQLKVLNFSIDWIITGEGTMHLPTQDEASLSSIELDLIPPPSIDEELLGLIFDGISKISRDDNLRLPPIELGRLSGRILSDLMAAYADPADRRTGLKVALTQLRRELLTPPAADTTGKRSA